MSDVTQEDVAEVLDDMAVERAQDIRLECLRLAADGCEGWQSGGVPERAAEFEHVMDGASTAEQ